MPNIEDELDYYQKLDCKSWSDNDFFEVLARTIFAGIRDETVEKRWPAITKAFSNFNIHKAAKYKEKDVKRLMKNPKVIKNERKIRYVIADARKMEEIIEEYGSFSNYIHSFSSMDGLIEKLQGFNKGFKGIGEVNVYEFVKELGFPFIKPDRQVRKVFLRLGLIGEKASPEEIVEIGKTMAKAVKERAREYISGVDEGVCNVTIPKNLVCCNSLGDWEVLLDEVKIDYSINQNETHTFIYFTYDCNVQNVQNVQIIGTEFLVPPTILVISPENKTYSVNSVSLTFSVSSPASWIGYSLDGQTNVTITGNTTLSWMCDGLHSVVVYVKETAGQIGASEMICFSINTQQAESFPQWIVAVIVIIAAVEAVLLVYLIKVKKTVEKVKQQFQSSHHSLFYHSS